MRDVGAMEYVQEHVRFIDGQLEQSLLSSLGPQQESLRTFPPHVSPKIADVSAKATPRTAQLRSLLGRLPRESAGTFSLTSSSRLLEVLRIFRTSIREQTDVAVLHNDSVESYEDQISWFLLGKVTSHAYGHVLQDLFNQTLSLSNDIWYWTDVASSTRYIALYSIQTSPVRFWHWSTEIREGVRNSGVTNSDGWTQFYGHVKNVILDRSVTDIRFQVTVPLAMMRSEVRRKIAVLERTRAVHASAIGYLLIHGFHGGKLSVDDFLGDSDANASSARAWKSIVVATVSALDAVLNSMGNSTLDQATFEATVKASTAVDSLDDLQRNPADVGSSKQAATLFSRQGEVVDRLSDILSTRLPELRQGFCKIQDANSKPSRLTRYWPPAVAMLLFSGTMLRIVFRRRAAISQWIRELGSTVIDFWTNWIVEPAKKVIGTIRHDEGSEVSIMSKRSLEGDRESLQRMVVDFAIDNPDGPALSSAAIADIRSKVQEGDLTSVLRAYERELKSPLYGTVRGNLIRTLLIQVQKTKVDVEVAMRGIDNLLKSQELVFGLVGLTPGVIVLIGLFRWFGSFSSDRKMTQKGHKQSHAAEILRNIDRILTGSFQSNVATLSYREYGLLVCEAAALREIGVKTLPKQVVREFLVDFKLLIDDGSGIGRQIRVADRIRWAYLKWF